MKYQTYRAYFMIGLHSIPCLYFQTYDEAYQSVIYQAIESIEGKKLNSYYHYKDPECLIPTSNQLTTIKNVIQTIPNGIIACEQQYGNLIYKKLKAIHNNGNYLGGYLSKWNQIHLESVPYKPKSSNGDNQWDTIYYFVRASVMSHMIIYGTEVIDE